MTRRVILLFGMLALAACHAGVEPDCDRDPTYSFSEMPAAATGAVCEVVFSAPGKEARYSFPPLLDCADNAKPVPCVETAGPRPTGCEISGCWVRLDFKGATGQELFQYLGRYIFTYTINCDDSPVSSGTVEPIGCGV